MEKLAIRLVVVAALIIVGLGIYAFNLRNALAQAQTNMAAAMQNRDEFRHRLDDVTKAANANALANTTCAADLKDAQAQLDDAAKHGGRLQKH